jgi:hypothetical protein
VAFCPSQYRSSGNDNIWWLASAGADNTVRIWKVVEKEERYLREVEEVGEERELYHYILPMGSKAFTVVWSPIRSAEDGEIEVEEVEEIGELELKTKTRVRIAVGTKTNAIRIWDGVVHSTHQRRRSRSRRILPAVVPPVEQRIPIDQTIHSRQQELSNLQQPIAAQVVPTELLQSYVHNPKVIEWFRNTWKFILRFRSFIVIVVVLVFLTIRS